MKNKLIFLLFTFIFLIGIVVSSGETITTIDAFEDIGSLISNSIESGEISAKGIEFIKTEDSNHLKFLAGGTLRVGESLYGNVKEGSFMELDNFGKITFADLTTTKETIFNFDGVDYKVPAGKNIIYDKGKITSDIIEFKDDFSSTYTKITALNDKISLINDGAENSIIEGNFKIGNDEFKGLGEGKKGKIIYSKSNGKVSEIGTGTDATINGVRNKVSFSNLKVYYEDNFDLAKCSGNCINYGKNSISLKGDGFTTDLTKSYLLSDFSSYKEVKGIGTKTRNLEVSMDGGNMEISKGTGSEFNVIGSGKYIIDNGRTHIYSQEDNKLLARVNYGEGEKYGLTYSYDLNLNNGEYKLKDNVFMNSKGDVLFNTNLEWEEIIRKINEGSYKDFEIREIIDSQTGTRSRDYTYLLKDREALAKYFCEARDSVNKNNESTKITFEELFTRYMLEGGAFYTEGRPVYEFDNTGVNAHINGSRIGLDFIKANQAALEKGGFLEQGFLNKFPKEPIFNEENRAMETLTFTNIKDSIIAFAGELTRRKYVFEKDVVNTFGQEELQKMSNEEKYFWLTYYFNAGEGAGKGELTGTAYETYVYDPSTGVTSKKTVIGKGRKNVYRKWVGEEIGTNPRFNSRLSEGTYALMKNWGIFSYV